MAKYYKLSDLRKILNSCAQEYETKLGKPDKVIETFFRMDDGLWQIINEFRLYSQSKCLLFITANKQYVIPFNKIIGYDVINLNQEKTPLISATTTVTKTDTGSLVKRAVIGGLAAGGLGAIIGAATAKKTTTTQMSKVDEYTNMLRSHLNSLPNLNLILNIDDLVSSSITIPFDQFKEEVEKVVSTLNVIIRNNAKCVDEEETQIIICQSKLSSNGRKLGLKSRDLEKERRLEKQKEIAERLAANKKERRKEIVQGIVLILFFIMIISMFIWAWSIS